MMKRFFGRLWLLFPVALAACGDSSTASGANDGLLDGSVLLADGSAHDANTRSADGAVATVDGGAQQLDGSTSAQDGGAAHDAGSVSDASTAGDGATGTDAATSASSLTGTLGALGAVQPTVSGLVISNSGETLIYLSSATLACADIQQSRWLGMRPSGSQVVEIVVKGAPKVQKYDVSPSEVNYAPGGMSSAYENSASAGSITFTEASANGPVAGDITATFANPTGNVSGHFHAEFCAGGQQF